MRTFPTSLPGVTYQLPDKVAAPGGETRDFKQALADAWAEYWQQARQDTARPAAA